MLNPGDENQVIARLIQWGESKPAVRAMLLTSSRAVPGAQVDPFSDYDVILVLEDVRPFYEDRGWLEAFGRVLVLYRDPLMPQDGFLKAAYVTQYEDGLKIDFTLWPVELLQQVVASPVLPPEFDAGYRVLLDKDHLADGLWAPAYRGYLPSPPAEAEFQTLIEEFFLDATYVAKYLWRDDVVAAKHILDHSMKQEYLLPMLVWRIEIDQGWSLKPGPYGRRLKKWLRPDLWADLESIYVGPGLEENWQALFRSIALMRKVALEVSDRLGFGYPQDLEQRVGDYLERVKTFS